MASPRRLSKNPPLFVKEIQDSHARENFKFLDEYFDNQNQLLDFKFIETSLTSGNNQRIAHGLGFVPKDIIRLSITGSGTVTFKKGSFNSQYLFVDSTGDIDIRLFAGTYFKSQGVANFLESDTETWSAGSESVDTESDSETSVAVVKSNYSVQESDDLLLIESGSASTITIPDASDSSSRIIKIQKNYDDFTSHTILSQSRQEIDGDSSISLNTYKESVTLLSKNSEWIVVDRNIPSYWRNVSNSSYATPTFAAGFGTTANESYLWRRVGDSIFYRIQGQAGTVAGTEMSVTLPTTITIDSLKLPANASGMQLDGFASQFNTGASSNIWSDGLLGFSFYDGSDITKIFFAQRTASNAYQKLNVSQILGNSMYFSITFNVPISGWDG